jgi:hypothetical protein
VRGEEGMLCVTHKQQLLFGGVVSAGLDLKRPSLESHTYFVLKSPNNKAMSQYVLRKNGNSPNSLVMTVQIKFIPLFLVLVCPKNQGMNKLQKDLRYL